MTRYGVEAVMTRIVMHKPTETITILSTPLTQAFTIEEGATQLYQSVPPALATVASGQLSLQGLRSNCSLHMPEGSGECVDEVKIPRLIFDGASGASDIFHTETSTYTTTYTGTLKPLATIEASGGLACRLHFDIPFGAVLFTSLVISMS